MRGKDSFLFADGSSMAKTSFLLLWSVKKPCHFVHFWLQVASFWEHQPVKLRLEMFWIGDGFDFFIRIVFTYSLATALSVTTASTPPLNKSIIATTVFSNFLMFLFSFPSN